MPRQIFSRWPREPWKVRQPVQERAIGQVSTGVVRVFRNYGSRLSKVFPSTYFYTSQAATEYCIPDEPTKTRGLA